MSFRVGQKVVCVDDDPHGDNGIFPTKGKIYTIAWSGQWRHPAYGDTNPCVHLVEIKRPASKQIFCVVPYLASRFRPVAERKTDISIFKAMLKDTKAPALVRVPDGAAGRP